MTEKTDRSQLLLAAYDIQPSPVRELQRLFGGKVRSLRQSAWLKTTPTPPTRVGRSLEILHGPRPRPLRADQLVIPHGLAFGSGDHATTFMLLRALARRKTWGRVLDLGTGSGVLALAARKLGAERITATDFDADAVRTARANEMLNYKEGMVRWSRADVLKLRRVRRYDLVLANLFSGVLIEAAPRIAQVVAPGGDLWMSGILRTQLREVENAYRAQGLRVDRPTTRGKWVMVPCARPLQA